MHDWSELGRIVHLQIQRSSLKMGPPKGRYYDPAPLRSVESITLTPEGVSLETGDGTIYDVHNALHPETKHVQGINGVSIGFTSHYSAMRERFHAGLCDGIAGENILIECTGLVRLDDIAGGLKVTGADGREIQLHGVRVAHPCVEFSRFALDDPLAPPALVSEALKFLDGGLRGFYAAVPNGSRARIRLGDIVWGRAA
ncbi:MAG: hypothetical protein DCC58_16430 [Chloroflexi bacterium]|nr:MAG: hypothetical protein DCC58_16430 [Chloroflexota bacterium]